MKTAKRRHAHRHVTMVCAKTMTIYAKKNAMSVPAANAKPMTTSAPELRYVTTPTLSARHPALPTPSAQERPAQRHAAFQKVCVKTMILSAMAIVTTDVMAVIVRMMIPCVLLTVKSVLPALVFLNAVPQLLYVIHLSILMSV